MTVYDCRKENRTPGSQSFPCAVRIVDPATGERISNVFFAQTSPAKIGRFVTGADGEPMVDANSRRKIGYTTETGERRCRIEHDRLEQWIMRPWVAIALDTGEVIVKSEGVS